MLVLLSPAKTLDESPTTVDNFSQPRLMDKTESLVKELKKKSARSLKKLMAVSDQIAELNVVRYQNFSAPFSLNNAKQAALMFKGDVYLGLEASTFDEKELAFAQKYVRILSGLYGLLKPLDLIQPYRLEMGTALKKGRKKNLYEFWGDQITKIVNQDLQENEDSIILNLASKEYFKSVQPKLLSGQLITVHFKENRNGVYKVISFNAKKARGAMAKTIVQHSITNPEALKEFTIHGYTFNEEIATEHAWIYTMG